MLSEHGSAIIGNKGEQVWKRSERERWRVGEGWTRDTAPSRLVKKRQKGQGGVCLNETVADLLLSRGPC